VFNFKILGYSIEDLEPNGNHIQTDDFCTNKRRSRSNQDGLLLNDFALEEVQQTFMSTLSVFTTVIGPGSTDEAKEIRSCTTKEYYHLTGKTIYSKKLNLQQERSWIQLIGSKIPTSKTCRTETFLEYAVNILVHLSTLFGFYHKKMAHNRFNLYQGC
jgi:hypothetical protein